MGEIGIGRMAGVDLGATGSAGEEAAIVFAGDAAGSTEVRLRRKVRRLVMGVTLEALGGRHWLIYLTCCAQYIERASSDRYEKRYGNEEDDNGQDGRYVRACANTKSVIRTASLHLRIRVEIHNSTAARFPFGDVRLAQGAPLRRRLTAQFADDVPRSQAQHGGVSGIRDLQFGQLFHPHIG